jgi:hypothetical protein
MIASLHFEDFGTVHSDFCRDIFKRKLGTDAANGGYGTVKLKPRFAADSLFSSPKNDDHCINCFLEIK